MSYFDQFEEVKDTTATKDVDYFAQFEEVAPVMGAGEAAWEGGKQGLTFGFGDEASAAVVAGVTSVGNFFDDLYETDEEERMRLLQGEFYKPESETRQSFSENYTQSRDRFRADYDKAGEDQEGARLLGELAGGLTTAVIPVGAAARTGKVLDTSIKSAMTTGGAGGAAYGLGASKADLTKGEFAQAAVDTAEGAAYGVVGGGVIKGATKLPGLAKDGKQYVGDKLAAFKDDPVKAVKDLIPSGTDELIAQGIGHSLYPGGGFAAQSLLRKGKKMHAAHAERKAGEAVEREAADAAEAVIQKESLAKRAFKDKMAKKEADRAAIYKTDQEALKLQQEAAEAAKRQADADALLPENVAKAEETKIKSQNILDMINARSSSTAPREVIQEVTQAKPVNKTVAEEVLATIRARGNKPTTLDNLKVKMAKTETETHQRLSTGIADDVDTSIPTKIELETEIAALEKRYGYGKEVIEQAESGILKDPAKQAQMKLLSVNRKISKETNSYKLMELQREVDDLDKALTSGDFSDYTNAYSSNNKMPSNTRMRYEDLKMDLNRLTEPTQMPMGIKTIETLLDTDPSKLGIYAERLRTAKERGPQALISTDFILKQQHPEYNVLIKNLRK